MSGAVAEGPEAERRLRRQRRVVWGLAALGAVLALAGWRFWYVPWRVDVLLDRAYRSYEDERVSDAVAELQRALSLGGERVDANLLLGWSHWRMGHPVDAEAHFRRAYQVDPTVVDVKQALAMALVTLGRPEDAVPLLEEASRARPQEMALRLALADALRRSGRNQAAADLYRRLLADDPSLYQAEKALLEIFGYPRLDAGRPFALPERARPADTRLPFRTRGDFFQALDGDTWRTAYLTGVNLGPGRPNEFAVSASLDFETYREWLVQIADMNANTVRTYTILPPAFYQALLAHNQGASEPLWLIQEIWLHDLALNLYDPATKADFEEELRNTIDVLHGQADVPCVPGHYCGVYTADVSPWVIGLGVGREVEPKVVLHTNRLNPQYTSWRGEYVSLDRGSPSEVWFAEMCDLAARYEMERYNAQRPLTVVNWPPLDPMHHPTEATYAEEIAIRRALGERVQDSVPQDMNDSDVETIDITRFTTGEAFQAGLFALYHVYQHWPDFLFLDPAYAEASDAQGVNRYLGYLLDLKAAHRDFPLLIGEYGLATSMLPAHLHPEGWHNGGLTYQEQSELLLRFTRNIRDTDMAGGIVFAWLDEWWKQVHDEFTAPLEPRANDPLWLNRLDPEEHFGLVGYEPWEPVPLLRGEETDWNRADTLYQRPDPGSGNGGGGEALRAVYATSDYNYLYLRLDVAQDPSRWGGTSLQVALNTMPGAAGTTLVPDADVVLPTGANFLLRVDDGERARLLVAENYNPWEHWPVPGRPDQTRILRKQGLGLGLAEVPFEPMIIEANPPRWGRDGQEFPSLNLDRSELPRGTADRRRLDFTSHAVWNLDPVAGMLEVRLPWSLLLVTDPSQRTAFVGTDPNRDPLSGPSGSVSVAAFLVRAAEPAGGQESAPSRLVSSFPASRAGFRGVRRAGIEGPLAVYRWSPWRTARYRPYFKPSYFALQALWSAWPRFLD